MNKIKEIREMQNLTQEEIAREINISLSSMRNIEKNRSIPNVYVAIELAKKLNTKVEELFIIEK